MFRKYVTNTINEASDYGMKKVNRKVQEEQQAEVAANP